VAAGSSRASSRAAPADVGSIGRPKAYFGD